MRRQTKDDPLVDTQALKLRPPRRLGGRCDVCSNWHTKRDSSRESRAMENRSSSLRSSGCRANNRGGKKKRVPHPSALRAYGLRMTARSDCERQRRKAEDRLLKPEGPAHAKARVFPRSVQAVPRRLPFMRCLLADCYAFAGIFGHDGDWRRILIW
jgi:hypothetical protein